MSENCPIAMSDPKHWKKEIVWSEEDKLFLGSLPGHAMGYCCHGETEEAVLKELQEIAEELAADKRDGVMPEGVVIDD